MEIKKIKALDKPVTVAVYKKSIKSKTHYMLVTKPLIDHKYEIIELGVGLSFAESWMKRYKIKKYTFVE